MAQSALTVTPPNPTPPTNMGFTGATAPNPPNYTKNTYNDAKNWGTGTPTYPPPYFDDGSAGALTQITSAQPALASGSGATAGGCEGTYPGAANGAVPASTSVDGEGRGTEVVVTSPGSRAECPTQQVSVLGNFTGIATAGGVINTPNATHASSLSPAVNPTLTSISAGGASGTGTATATATGTGFTRQSVMWVNGIPYATTFVSSTSLTCVAPKKASAGSLPVIVVTGGVVQTASQNWTFT